MKSDAEQELPYLTTFRRDRRAFLFGALASGAFSLAAGTLRDKLPGSVRADLRVAVGNKAFGLFELLASLYATRTGTTVKVLRAGEGAVEQLNFMRDHAGPDAGSSDVVDVLGVDVVHMSVLAEQKCLVPIPGTRPIDFLSAPLATCRLPGGFYGVPFSTNVGVLFRRAGTKRAAGALADLLRDDATLTWAAQLPARPGEHSEGLLCNFLEHVLAVEGCGSLITPTGKLVDDFGLWDKAMQAIRTSISHRRLRPYPEDNEGLRLFNGGRVDYMRNWPTFLHRTAGLEKVLPSDLSPVGAGVLGGMNLSVATRARDGAQAWAFIEFMVSLEAQKIVALYGYPPTHTRVYDDPDLKTAIPHLATLKEAVTKAKIRPVIPVYDQFSAAVVEVVTRCLGPDGGHITQPDMDRWQSYF